MKNGFNQIKEQSTNHIELEKLNSKTVKSAAFIDFS